MTDQIPEHVGEPVDLEMGGFFDEETQKFTVEVKGKGVRAVVELEEHGLDVVETVLAYLPVITNQVLESIIEEIERQTLGLEPSQEEPHV